MRQARCNIHHYWLSLWAACPIAVKPLVLIKTSDLNLLSPWAFRSPPASSSPLDLAMPLAVALGLAQEAAIAHQKIPGSISAHQNLIHAKQPDAQSAARFHGQNG